MSVPAPHSKEIDMDTSTFKVFAQRLRAHLQQHRISLRANFLGRDSTTAGAGAERRR
jgi:hypothetical protein